MLNRFNETFSGWGTETRGGGTAGFEGYLEHRANVVAEEVRKNMRATRGIKEILVTVVPIGKDEDGRDRYKVVNNSTYESSF